MVYCLEGLVLPADGAQQLPWSGAIPITSSEPGKPFRQRIVKLTISKR